MLNYKGNFIGGKWKEVIQPQGIIERENPADISTVEFRAPWSTADVDEAVENARLAQPNWQELGLEKRIAYVHRLAGELKNQRERLAHTISNEMGKPLWEALGEADALISKINIMSTEGLDYTMTVHPPGLQGGSFHYRPFGVLAVLAPYNFPLHLANGHIIPGLLTGNTIVVKPSEFSPGSMQLYFECVQRAGFPPGVINLVQGPGPVGAALSAHPDIDAILFTGSYETGLKIKEATLRDYWKLLALEMGGKNTSIILEDANIQQSAHEILLASCLTTGQRCSATSRIVLMPGIEDQFIEIFSALLKRITTGHPVKEDIFMGPLSTRAAFEKFQRAQNDNENGALETIVQGGTTRHDLDGYFISPSLWYANSANAKGTHQGCEIFGPDIILYSASTIDDAVDIANATDYGLAMSIFTNDENIFEKLSPRLKTGILNLNRSTVGASSRLPFGGVKKSGNHRPAAILSGLYCTYPQSQLREPSHWDDDKSQAGPLQYLQPN